jgi:hypothetical protein
MELLKIKKNNETTMDEAIETFDATVVKEGDIDNLYSAKVIAALKEVDGDKFSLATCHHCITDKVYEAIDALFPSNYDSIKFCLPCNEMIITSYKESRWAKPYYLLTLPEEEVL